MLYKRCSKCGKRMEMGQKCSCCKRDYSTNKRSRKEYHNNRWAKLRQYVMARHDYLDAYALEQGNVIPADTVHHIIPVRDDETLFFEPTNLIPVSRASHDTIHAAYDRGDLEKKSMVSMLQSIVEKKIFDET